MTYNKVIVCDIRYKKQTKIVNAADYKKTLKEFEYACELVAGEGQQVKPYFDLDPVDEDAFDWDADRLKIKLSIQTLFGNAIDINDIYVVKRQYEKNGKTKYSSHYTVDKIRMSWYNIKLMIEEKKSQGLDMPTYDMSVYSTERGVYGPYTNTKLTDGKKLTLPPFLPEGDADISKYLISYIEEDFVDWDVNFDPKKPDDPVKEQDNSVLKQINTSFEDADMIKGLLDCLSVSRADDYGDWLNVGFCLYNINTATLDLWIEFSKKSDKYEEGACDKLWYKMAKKGMSVGTLKYWAKLDNFSKYKKVINQSLDKYIECAIASDGSHYDIALCTSRLMEDKVVYDSKMKMWYFVDDKTNIWESDREGNKMVQILAVDVCKVFMKASHKYSVKATESDPTFKVMYEEKSKKSISIAKQLKNASFQDSLKKCCKSTFMKNDFFEKFIDKKIELFAFTNCVFDCNEKQFRAIEPTDYIMTTTGYDYIENVPQFYIDEVMRILIEIQPNFQRLWYLLDTLSCRLFGKNFLQTFSIWTGIGANGKSLLGNLLDNAFGKYYAKLSSDTITKESKSANSTSEFSRVSSCRTLLFEEPAENTKLQTAILKEHSGDAKVRTRGLFQESYEYTPQYGMIICCNEIPELSKIGGHAITRRLRIINFPTKFCENPTKPHERVCDKNLNEKITNDNNYRNAFIKILIDNWIKKDLKTNFLTPECILEDSKEYLDNCNHIKSFLEEKYDYLEYTAENKAKIKSSELFSDFKYYLAANRIDIKVTDKTFKVFVEAEGFALLKKKDGNYYMNIKKREELEDE